MHKYFSKSKLIALRQCEKRLWLEIHHPEFKDDSAQTQKSYQIGHQIGDLARKIYDPEGIGVLIDAQTEGYPQALTRSKEFFNERQPIFEAGFSGGGALAFADIMLPHPRKKNSWGMIEVKSSTSVKDYHRDDVAIQAYAAQAAGINLVAVGIACIDSSWIYPGERNYQGLLTLNDLTEEALSRGNEVREWVAQAQGIAVLHQEPDVPTGPHCNTPYECGFHSYCSRNEPQAEYPITWLPRLSAQKREELLQVGIIDMRGVPDDRLNAVQLMVKECTLKNKAFFDQKGAANALAAYPLPAQFLDFETIQFAVPIWAGTKPYQQIPYQFSVHTLDEKGDLRHEEFLNLDGSDPSHGFVDALIRYCGGHGHPVFVYNAAFERSRISELAQRFPKNAKALLSISERIVDLLPIAREHYYHPSQQGSWSIKAVLPAAVPELSYADLEGVQDGGMAMDAYLEAIADETTEARKEEIRKQLLAYCKLDTYAMVRLWAAFTGMIIK